MPLGSIKDSDLESTTVALPPPKSSRSFFARAALGERAGAWDQRVGRGTRAEPFVKGPLCAELDGFSLHAAVRVEGRDRDRLEHLCRYAGRAAIGRIVGGCHLGAEQRAREVRQEAFGAADVAQARELQAVEGAQDAEHARQPAELVAFRVGRAEAVDRHVRQISLGWGREPGGMPCWRAGRQGC